MSAILHRVKFQNFHTVRYRISLNFIIILEYKEFIPL